MIDGMSLHRSLTDPSLQSINFLNEVVARYPEAISFAPGAPFEEFFDEVSIEDCINRYSVHTAEKVGISFLAARRRLFQYGPSQGLIGDLIAKSLRSDFTMDIDASSIVVTVGCQEAMFLVLRALFSSTRDVLAVVEPCFPGILGAAKLLDIEVVGLEEREGSFDRRQLDRLCDHARARGKRVRALYVAPDYSNPTGSILSEEARLELLEAAGAEDFFLLEDNAYGFTADPTEARPTLKALDQDRRVIYLGTFAKIGFPGARVGFAVADQMTSTRGGGEIPLAKELAAIKSMLTVNTSPICQAVIGGLLLQHNCSLASLARKKSLFYRSNLKALLEALDRKFGTLAQLGKVSWNAPAGGFFVRLRLPVSADEALLDLSARQYGVLWTPMRIFYCSAESCPEIRLSCSNLTEALISEGVTRLAKFVQGLPGV
jgi:(S)-3,5-dihydroxyphenylglycine transaminase